MVAIRPLEREDLPAVADLYELVARSGAARAAPGLADYLAALLLDHPWLDPDIPSLVATDREGRVVAFLGSHVRRLEVDGEPARLACGGQLVAHPRARALAPGALLLRRYLAGPQDLTITDGATPRVQRMWERLGGDASHLRCIVWTRVLRPFGYAALIARRRGLARPLARLHRPWSLLDAGLSRLPRLPLRVPASLLTAEELTPAGLLDGLAQLGAGLRLRVAYDRPFLDWLFDAMARAGGRGPLVRRLLRDGEGRTAGWYVCYLPREEICEVVQVAAREEQADAVLGHLFYEASGGGAVAVRGRLEPPLAWPLRRHGCLLHFAGGALVHSRRPEVLAAALSGRGFLTRMDGEWWMDPHLRPPL